MQQEITFIQQISNQLFSESNVSGAWLAIAATVALTGVIINSFLSFLGGLISDKAAFTRDKVKREHDLIREVYFDAIDYLNFCFHKISGMANGVLTSSSEDAQATINYYRIFLVASPEVISAFLEVSKENGRIFFSLANMVMDFTAISNELAGFELDRKHAVETMENLNKERRYYTENNQMNDGLSNLMNSQFAEAQSRFDESVRRCDDAQARKAKQHLELLKSCSIAMLDISSGIYDAILAMRDDLDRKLALDLKVEIRQEIDLMLSGVGEQSKTFVDGLDAKINSLQAAHDN